MHRYMLHSAWLCMRMTARLSVLNQSITACMASCRGEAGAVSSLFNGAGCEVFVTHP